MVDSMHCPACGSRVQLPEASDGDPVVTRDGMLSEMPGRATITVGGETVHRCAEGRFLPPDRSY